MSIAEQCRKQLYLENKKRFMEGEREGHMEDLLVSTILDPRFKLMNFHGCTAEMKGNAEKWLKANYVADWGPERPDNVDNVPAPLQAAKKKPPTSGFCAFMSLVDGQVDSGMDDQPEQPQPSQQAQSEVEKYLSLPQLPLHRNGKDTNPLEWWKMHEHELPHLSKMARQFLAMPASSAGPERLFSGSGKMHDDQKKNTKEDTLSMQLEVKMNV